MACLRQTSVRQRQTISKIVLMRSSQKLWWSVSVWTGRTYNSYLQWFDENGFMNKTRVRSFVTKMRLTSLRYVLLLFFVFWWLFYAKRSSLPSCWL